MIRRSRHQPPTQPLQVEPTIYRTLEPVAGINQDQPPEHLKPNEAWDMDNFTPEEKFVRVRSGATKLGTVSTAFANKTYFHHFATLHDLSIGAEWLVGLSSGSVAISRATGVDCAWSGTTIPSLTPISAATTAFYNTAQIYDSDRKTNLLIITDGADVPKALTVAAGVPSLISLALSAVWEFSHPELPKYCTAFDDRAVLVSEYTGSGVQVFWSDRGRPQYWNGELDTVPGTEILYSLKGNATGIASDIDRMYLFSNLETWEATPRRDVFSFDFTKIKNIGCGFPATIATTPAGVAFVTPDLRIALASGGGVRYIDNKIGTYFRSQSADTWALKATYDEHENAYALFYSTTAGAYANRCIKLNLETGAWYKHSSTSETWVGVGSTPLSSGTHKRGLVYGGSDGSVYAFHSQQSTDVGRNINATYDTPALNTDYRGMLAPVEAWVEHESDFTSAFTVVYSPDKFSQSSAVFGGVQLPSTHTATNFIPGTGQASRHPQFRFQMTNNVASKVARVHLALRPYSGRWPV